MSTERDIFDVLSLLLSLHFKFANIFEKNEAIATNIRNVTFHVLPNAHYTFLSVSLQEICSLLIR